MSQRYSVSGPLSHAEDMSIRFRLPELHKKFSSRWAEHQCNKPGCQETIIFDGGMKAQVILFCLLF